MESLQELTVFTVYQAMARGNNLGHFCEDARNNSMGLNILRFCPILLRNKNFVVESCTNHAQPIFSACAVHVNPTAYYIWSLSYSQCFEAEWRSSTSYIINCCFLSNKYPSSAVYLFYKPRLDFKGIAEGCPV